MDCPNQRYQPGNLELAAAMRMPASASYSLHEWRKNVK